MDRIGLPPGYWLAHQHWVREAEAEGRGRWVPARLSELNPEIAQAVMAEIDKISAHFGPERAPKLWRAVE